MKQPSEYKVWVGKRNGKIEVTLLNPDGSYQTVCDCGTVNVLRHGRRLPTKCRECVINDRAQSSMRFIKTDAEIRPYAIQEEAWIENFKRSES